jgi:hypothetical protein
MRNRGGKGWKGRRGWKTTGPPFLPILPILLYDRQS